MIDPAHLAERSQEAATRITPHVRRTPLELLTAPGTSDPAWAKCEHLQITGSFKVRGALSALSQLSGAERAAGVITASTGNHGAGVAYGGHRLGIGATVFAPQSADPSKLASIERWGGSIELVAGDPVEAEFAARQTAQSTGATYVSPYNDPVVIAGQGTIALELVDQLENIDTLVVAVGGGGLISGIAAVARQRWPHVRIVGACAANSNVMMQSVAAGQIVDVPSLATLSDGTAGGVEPDSITFDLCRTLVDDWVAISEQQIADEVRSFAAVHHQLIEGAGGVALAAWRELAPPGTTVVVSCGANISPDRAAAILGEVDG